MKKACITVWTFIKTNSCLLCLALIISVSIVAPVILIAVYNLGNLSTADQLASVISASIAAVGFPFVIIQLQAQRRTQEIQNAADVYGSVRDALETYLLYCTKPEHCRKKKVGDIYLQTLLNSLEVACLLFNKQHMSGDSANLIKDFLADTLIQILQTPEINKYIEEDTSNDPEVLCLIKEFILLNREKFVHYDNFVKSAFHISIASPL